MTETETEDIDVEQEQKLRRLVTRGYTYREDYDFEMFGETVPLQLKPIPDEDYRNLLKIMQAEMGKEEMRDAIKAANEADDPDDVDLESMFSVGQTAALQEAAVLGIDPDSVGEDEEGVRELVTMMVGQRSLQIGMKVMELSSDVGDNEFRP